MIKSKGNEDVYENEVLINKQYFYLDNENKVKIHILLKPVISENEEVKRIFMEGIKKSLYFIHSNDPSAWLCLLALSKAEAMAINIILPSKTKKNSENYIIEGKEKAKQNKEFIYSA